MKDLTIMEAKSKREHLENLREYYLTKKEMNLTRLLPSSPSFDKENVNGGARVDRYANYVIKNEEIDAQIELIDKEIYALDKFIEVELKRLDEYDEYQQKVIYMKESGLSWFQIAMKTPFSISTCRRIYRKYKGKRNE